MRWTTLLFCEQDGRQKLDLAAKHLAQVEFRNAGNARDQETIGFGEGA